MREENEAGQACVEKIQDHLNVRGISCRGAEVCGCFFGGKTEVRGLEEGCKGCVWVGLLLIRGGVVE